jgi:hypothetical protein
MNRRESLVFAIGKEVVAGGGIELPAQGFWIPNAPERDVPVGHVFS